MGWRYLIALRSAKILLIYMDIFGYIYGYGVSFIEIQK